MKKIISIALAIILTITSILIFPGRGGDEMNEILASDHTFDSSNIQSIEGQTVGSFVISDILAGQTPRDGYILAPTLLSLSGINTLSSFVLRTPDGYSTRTPSISIDGQAHPTLTREDSNTFIVTPIVPLTPNSVYVLRLNRNDGEDITWVFQTAVRFEITSTLPRNQATNVPVRTGIEVSFSIGDNINISDHFRIYPNVEGEFIHRDSTTIFAPTNPLEHSQIYTVTISSGISAPGTSEAIANDLIFSFETAQETVQTQRNHSWNISFHNRIVEFPTFSNPSVGFWHQHNREGARDVLNISTYRIDNREQAISAANRLAGTHSWSIIWQEDRFIDTSSLTNVDASRPRTNRTDSWGRSESFTIPISLPPGFYVIDATSGDSRDQMIIQITDLAVQVIADDSKAIVWVNDMSTGLPTVSAAVYDPITGRTFETSEYGIAVIDRMLSAGEYLIVTAADGRENVVFAHSGAFQSFHGGFGHSWDIGLDHWDFSPRMNIHTANNHYWTVLQLDRTLFQRSDTLSLWGFAQNRRQQENITHVTAVLRENSWHRSPEQDTLHRQNIPVVNGSYYGEIHLPNLSPGFYELAIFHGDIVLSSTFFNVMDYVKPPYQLIVSSDKNAIFAGEEVNFTARTEFFEGTPVPDLDISYRFWGWQLRAPGSGQRRTNVDGIIELSARPTAENASAQGERALNFTAEATLPEIGWTHQEQSVRVFVNDIDVNPRASRDGRDATLSVDVHGITLDRINDGTAEHWGDFLSAPTTGQRISVEIIEVYWVRIRDGQRYNHVTRQVVPWYRHERRERSVERFELITGSDGTATRNFQVPNRENASYIARLNTRDGNGRNMTFNVFIGRDWSWFFESANDDRLFLYGANTDGYDIGDEVELTIMRGSEAVAQGNFLFVVVQDGILSYHIGRNPLSFIFSERHVPNAQVFAYHFNGHTYTAGGQMSQRLTFNPTERKLNINISTCQETYRPGSMATVTVNVTDLNGRPVAANVNVSLVDEALFSLMDYTVDTLAMLYGRISDNLRFSLATHRTFVSDGIEDLESQNMYASARFAGGSTDSAMMAPTAMAESADMEDSGGGSANIREIFEDTAIFKSLRTNARGEASFTFRLPDNITSWRAAISAISDDLYAGNSIKNIRVTQPMFLHYTLNSMFLVGDSPYIGVNAFGTSLSGGEQVIFEVWRESTPLDIRRATGVSFERVNIPLWEMTTEGFGTIVIRATVGGYSDAVRHSYQVVNSHRLIDTAIFYEVTSDTVFAVNPGGLTNITFTDLGRGQFLSDLFNLRHIWRSGDRIEGLVARREATRLIQTHFPDVALFGEAGNFNILEYQTQSGGIAILPHADADLETTVMLLPFILDDVNIVALRGYLRNIFNNSPTDNKIIAMYGLAVLGDPVLLDLQNYAALIETTGLSARNITYIALGFAAIGDKQTARDIYDRHIAPNIQRIAPYYRINATTNRSSNLEATSITALLAAKLGQPEALGLHNYAARNRPVTLLMNIEQLKLISHKIENHTSEAASITYRLFGETVTRDLMHGGNFSLRIPAANMHEFNLISITGEVGAVSVVRTPLEEIEAVESSLDIRREFFKAGTNTRAATFEQGDLVRVSITIDYSSTSLHGTYVITDFLPAGLVHVPNSARFGNHSSTPGWWAHATSEGQRITFFDHNGRDRVRTYYYYARVINPGTFIAEGTLVQSLGARDYMAIGENAVLTINP
ncbi:MAG: Ig-like domain-containing protein [Defluviitaleaceae bacterium]|nr:Ig-like domain-containing protein [Defluviitaleaceae bacterium]